MADILILDHIFDDTSIEINELESSGKLVIRKYTDETNLTSSQLDSDIILCYDRYNLSANFLKKFKNLKLIVRVGSGTDNIDRNYCCNQNIIVKNVPSYGTDEVAEHALALLLALSRRLGYFQDNVKRGEWKRKAKDIYRISGKTLGLIGLGQIGSAMAQRGRALGLNVRAYDPYVQESVFKNLYVQKESSLIELIKNSDIISLHVPSTKETKNILNINLKKYFKKGCLLINTARGDVVEQELVTEGIEEAIFRGVGLDVLEIEPLQDNSPLKNIINHKDPEVSSRLLITSHTAYYSKESIIELRRTACQLVNNFISRE